MKLGDYVSVVDRARIRVLNGSYAGSRISRRGCTEVRKFQVVATGRMPINVSLTADTLIVTVDEPEEIFVAINNCNLLPHRADIGIRFITSDRDVTSELSKESKRAILRAYLGKDGA